jgi:hypothetical protein
MAMYKYMKFYGNDALICQTIRMSDAMLECLSFLLKKNNQICPMENIKTIKLMFDNLTDSN